MYNYHIKGRPFLSVSQILLPEPQQVHTSPESLHGITEITKTTSMFYCIELFILSLMIWPSTRSTTEPNADSSSDVTDRMTSQTVPGRDVVQETTVLLDTTVTDLGENNTFNASDGNMAVTKRFTKNNYLDHITLSISAVGIIGNTVSLIALQGPPFCLIPSSYILASLAVTDSITLITVEMKKMPYVQANLIDINTVGCKTYFFIIHLSKILSSWFVVLVCLERFVAICFPFRVREFCTKANALKGLAFIIVMGLIFSGIWTLSSDIFNSKCNTSFSTPETELRGKIIIVLGALMIGVLPMIILLILTPIMCAVLFKHSYSRKELTTTSSQSQEATKISTMLIVLCVTYIFLQLPMIIAHYLAWIRGEIVYTTTYLPISTLYKVGSVLESINYSCNLFLYIVCNGAFRRKIASFCDGIKKSKRTYSKSSDVPQSTMTDVRS